MSLIIPEVPDFELIPSLSEKFNSEQLTEIFENSFLNINNINPRQFLFICELLTFNKTHFEEFLQLLAIYINGCDKLDTEIKLQIENYLASKILKKFETQRHYSDYFQIFDQHYKNINTQEIQNPSENIVIFFVHHPVLLAHTNTLLKTLENRKSETKVVIASLEFSQSFADACKKIGCEFIRIEGKNLTEKLDKFIALTKIARHCIWLCVPQYLSYVSSLTDNISWWSLKFYPKITGVRHKLSGRGDDFSFNIDNERWINFGGSFDVKNDSHSAAPWAYRKNKFGAFCREELINDANYWQLVGAILGSNPLSTFHYCGKKAIHEKWASLYKIDLKRIVFLGWLKDPHLKIREMAIILDCYGMRHGSLLFEGMACNIPIVYPQIANNHNGLPLYYSQIKVKDSCENPNNFASFTTVDKAVALTSNLLQNESINTEFGKKINCIYNAYPKPSFDELETILDSEC